MADGRLSMVSHMLRALWRPAWGKICYLAGGFSIVSEVVYQTVPDDLAQKVPRLYNIVVWLAVHIPWWGFCVIGFLIFFAGLFELVHRLRLDVAAAKKRETAMAAGYSISMNEITKRFNERTSKIEESRDLLLAIAAKEFIEFQMPRFESVLNELAGSWEKCSARMKEIDWGNKNNSGQLPMRIADWVNSPADVIKTYAEIFGVPWPNVPPPPEMLIVTDAHLVHDNAKQLWSETQVKYRIALMNAREFERIVDLKNRLHRARTVIAAANGGKHQQ